MNKILFPHITWFLFLLIPFTIYGFYPSYFGKLFSNLPSIFHLHAGFMILWITMAITQPILIRKKKTRIHKFIGKASYFIMPFVFVTTYFMIRYVYYKQIEMFTAKVSNGDLALTSEGIAAKAAAYIAIGIFYLAWLLSFYLLAVANRKQILFHATYMFSAILTMLGPTVDRALGITLDYFGLPFNMVAEYAVFVFILLLLATLLIYQYKRGNTIKPTTVSVSIYAAGVLGYYFLPKTNFWNSFIALIM